MDISTCYNSYVASLIWHFILHTKPVECVSQSGGRLISLEMQLGAHLLAIQLLPSKSGHGCIQDSQAIC